MLADRVPRKKCWVRVEVVCEEARGIEIPAAETEPELAGHCLLHEIGWLLFAALGGRVGRCGSADSTRFTSPGGLEAGRLLSTSPTRAEPHLS